MKIYIAKTDDRAKYGFLYKSILEIFSKENTFELVSLTENSECIVCIGDLTQELIGLKKHGDKFLIRFLFRSDISNHFYTDISLVDYTFWISDLNINILYPYLQTSSKINVPFDFSLSNDTGNIKPEYDIYVNTAEFLYADSALFKIIRTLNRLTNLKINICSNNEDLKNIVNPNIEIADSSVNIKEHVKRSKLVIGSGYSILFAIKYGKPFIILGERGYGGIPTINNIEQFYKEFFQGTIGGRLDGALPENLVYEDVQKILHRSDDQTSEFASYLSAVSNSQNISIVKTIINLVSSTKKTSLSELCFNSDYTIVESNGKYWLLNRFTRFVVATLDEQYMKLLQSIINNSDIDKNSFQEDILLDLLENKVLLREL